LAVDFSQAGNPVIVPELQRCRGHARAPVLFVGLCR
jgi:hypothetical protein